MGKILDLSVYKEDTFDITFPDGEVINVRKPTQAVVIEMMRMSQFNKENQEEMIEAMVELCVSILNNNKNARQFDCDEINRRLDFIMVAAIIKGYSDWTQELQSNPF